MTGLAGYRQYHENNSPREFLAGMIVKRRARFIKPGESCWSIQVLCHAGRDGGRNVGHSKTHSSASAKHLQVACGTDEPAGT